MLQDLRRVEPVSINGRQGVWKLPTTVAAELAPGLSGSSYVYYVKFAKELKVFDLTEIAMNESALT